MTVSSSFREMNSVPGCDAKQHRRVAEFASENRKTTKTEFWEENNKTYRSPRTVLRLLLGVLLTVLLLVFGYGRVLRAQDTKLSLAQETEQSAKQAIVDPDQGEKHVLVLFSYTTSWQGERDVLKGLTSRIPSSVRLDIVFMDTKNIDKVQSEEITTQHIKLLQEKEDYDAVIAVDDDALSYIMKYRDTSFAGIPVIFNNINSRERAQKAAQDSMTAGIFENFFGAETVQLAKKLYPKAERVVGISDHSLTGLAMNELFREVEQSVDLRFETLDMMALTKEQIIEKVSSFGDETILLYLQFTQDRDGNLYGMEESYRFLTDITKIPLFKPDQGGVGMGVLGGCGGSYVDAGARTADIVMLALEGGDLSQIGVEDMEGQYVFDASLLKKYGISKSQLPAGTLYVNDTVPFWKEHSAILRPVIVVMLLLIIILALLIADRRRLETLVRSQKKLSDAELRRRKAESQSHAIGQFLSSVSHDLRTPLVSIVGYTDLALNETDEAKRTEYLEKIRSSGMLLTGLVSDTLDVSRVISGKTKINPVPTTFDKVTDSVITSVSETARKKRVRFSSQVQDGNLPIRVDQMKLQRIILNLLTNAVKFTPQGGQVSLEVEHLKERNKGCNFRICVSDTGVGMSEEFQKIMFEPFVQEHADPLHLGTQEGTGLGLTIVRNNVEQMGGFLEIRSKEGEGTVINAFLPIDVRPEEPVSEAVLEDAQKDYSLLRGMHVLVAEDSDMNTEVVCRILERKGISPTCVSDGRQAVDAFSQAPAGTFQVILMDLRMPGMNGYEAASRIRMLDREDAKTIPILALSADAYDEDIRRSKAAGMTGHIAKPIRPEILYDALAGLMSPPEHRLHTSRE